MHLRILVVAIVVLSAVCFAQGPGNTPFLQNGGPVPVDAYQIRYASNLNVGDSYIDISNAGLDGAALFYGTGANIAGAICVNVYAFASDEQLVACCSCPVTPNALVSLDVQKDLINNVVSQQAIPTSLAIKLTATRPLGGTPTCNNSSFAGTGGPGGTTVPTYVAGLVAWGTSLSANTSVTPASYSMLGGRFLPEQLSVGEQTRLTNLCMYINANNSGYGICNTCRQGGLAATKK
jgi:hypothetical protein